MTAVIAVEADQLGLFDAPFVEPALPAGASLAERFEAFHAVNPHVYAAIERQVLAQAAQGRRRISIKGIYEDMRRGRIATSGDTFRLNNSYPSFYARMVIAAHPHLRAFIEIRRALADREEA